MYLGNLINKELKHLKGIQMTYLYYNKNMTDKEQK